MFVGGGTKRQAAGTGCPRAGAEGLHPDPEASGISPDEGTVHPVLWPRLDAHRQEGPRGENARQLNDRSSRAINSSKPVSAAIPQGHLTAMSEPKDSARAALTTVTQQGNANPGKKSGRPRKTVGQPAKKTIEIALEAHLFDALEKRRKSDGVTRTAFINAALFSVLQGVRRPAQQSAVDIVAIDLARIFQVVVGSEKLILAARDPSGRPTLRPADELVRTFVVQVWASNLSRLREQLALHLDGLRTRSSNRKGDTK